MMRTSATEISWFPNLQAGLPAPARSHVEAFIVTAWKLVIDGRALLEDFDGGASQPDLVACLKLKLVDLLMELDLELRGVNNMDDDHLLPLAMQRGLSEVALIDGPGLIAAVGLDADRDEVREHVGKLWERLLAAFPGELPNPLLSDGQGPLLRALRNWSKLCRLGQVDDAFLTKLVKAI
jgi:hypothetical protein